MIDPKFWRGKRVFVTGHTGFKGSWLCLWLKMLGANVTGYALRAPSEPNLFAEARVAEVMTSIDGDVADLAKLQSALLKAEPEIVIHMAAQTLVRYSYRNPVETFRTNFLGSVHLLEAVRKCDSVRAVVMVASDKCYHNEEWVWGYREDSRLGGDDPYSGSKAASELAVSSYRQSFFSDEGAPAVGSARAGNVIGGGDWAEDRLVPDVMRALMSGVPAMIRNPNATRPWQHALEPLHGYLTLAERLFTDGSKFASAWNFGPTEAGERTVGWVVDELYRLWGSDVKWQYDSVPGPPEKTFLKVDSSKAHAYLGWRCKLRTSDTLEWTVAWTKAFQTGEAMQARTMSDIERFMELPALEGSAA